MKEIVVIFLITLIHGNDGGLYVQGPSLPVLGNTRVVLNCRTTDPGIDLSQFHLRKLMDGQWLIMPCLLCTTSEHKPSKRLVIPSFNSYWSGVYACISNNASTPDNSSQSLNLTMRQSRVENTFFPAENRTNTFTELKTPIIQPHWMPAGHMAFLTSPDNLVVQPGATVVMDCFIRSELQPQYFWSKVGEDWMLDSPRLTLGGVHAGHEGLYRCTAVEPGQSPLGNSRSIYVKVQGEADEPVTSCFFDTRRAAWVAAAGAAALLVVILVVGVFLVRAARRRAKQAKGPIDDHSQKKPIYKGSAESLPSSLTADTQPLV